MKLMHLIWNECWRDEIVPRIFAKPRKGMITYSLHLWCLLVDRRVCQGRLPYASWTFPHQARPSSLSKNGNGSEFLPGCWPGFSPISRCGYIHRPDWAWNIFCYGSRKNHTAAWINRGGIDPLLQSLPHNGRDRLWWSPSTHQQPAWVFAFCLSSCKREYQGRKHQAWI